MTSIPYTRSQRSLVLFALRWSGIQPTIGKGFRLAVSDRSNDFVEAETRGLVEISPKALGKESEAAGCLGSTTHSQIDLDARAMSLLVVDLSPYQADGVVGSDLEIVPGSTTAPQFFAAFNKLPRQPPARGSSAQSGYRSSSNRSPR